MIRKKEMDRGFESESYFKELLLRQFEAHCAENGHGNGLEAFTEYLINKNVITKKTRQRYAILKSFDKLYKENDCHKTNTVRDLAVIFDCSEKTIWNVLKHYSFDYE